MGQRKLRRPLANQAAIEQKAYQVKRKKKHTAKKQRKINRKK